jgi:hypothetical protein
MAMVSAHAHCEHTYKVASAIKRYPNLKWERKRLPPSARFTKKDKPAYLAKAVVGFNKATDTVTLMVAVENAFLAEAIILGKGRIITLEGGLMTAQGTHILDSGILTGGIHRPKADWWLGLYVGPPAEIENAF